MFAEMRRRWKIVPTWVKVAPVLLLLALISLVHYRIVVTGSDLMPLVQRLFFLPLFMASLLLGLKGGLICAALISLNYLHMVFDPRPDLHGGLEISLEVALYFFTGGLTGLLVDRERREARRVKEAENLALLGQAAAAVAHELKTPLVAIGGFAQRMQRDLSESDPNWEPLRIIVDQAGHMENLLKEMLDYTRPLELQLAKHDLGALVSDVVTLASLLAKESGVSIVAELPAAGLEIVADGGRLKQVFLNLVQNAVQASPQGSRVRVSIELNGEEAQVRVRDEGCGISPDDLSRIYFPFYTTKRRGTGLGLAISRKNIKAHGGRLSVESQPETGSTFTVHLPLKGPRP
jgi:two-component system, NtrC family, sensor histidine kinase HydH